MHSPKRCLIAFIFCGIITLIIYGSFTSDDRIHISGNIEPQVIGEQISSYNSSELLEILVKRSTERLKNEKLVKLTLEQDKRHSSTSEISSNIATPQITKLPKTITSHRNDKLLRQHFISELGKVEQFKFEKCNLTACFDLSLCKFSEPLKVHVVPRFRPNVGSFNVTSGESNLIHSTLIKIIKESKYFEPDPSKACIFLLEDDTLDRDPLSPSFRADISTANIFSMNDNYGMNHLVFNLYSGSWPDYREDDFAELKINAAILAKASNSLKHYRPHFDISIPLFPYNHPYSDTDLTERWLKDFISYYGEAQNQKSKSYFLTFKGKRYVFGSGSETRNSLYHLNNKRDVIMLTTCRHGKRWRELSDARCSEDEVNYSRYDFVHLMKESTFCLVPRGRRLGSFRFLEAMSFGCIPVVLSDNWVKPFEDIINWSSAVITFKENMILQVPDILRDYDNRTIENMRKNCLVLYQSYFSTIERIVLTTLSSIEMRIKNMLIQTIKEN